MIIGIDYDGTFSADPEGWSQVIQLMQSRGHKVVCVTGRSDEGEWGEQVKKGINGLIPIVFAGSEWKREAAKAKGWDVNVWIDDNPEYIALQHPLFVQHKK
ncbi:MAG TPA: hypothetical protein VM577_19085 [Anaerovoracaceae bacterium]|nr:hypothetical protein [Anaerovoracaceae bacterium]